MALADFWMPTWFYCLYIQEDKSWEWNRLFTEVASELQSEWDKEAESKDAKESAT